MPTTRTPERFMAATSALGINDVERQRRLAAERREKRICVTCPTQLSRYNSTAQCGPCRVQEQDRQIAAAANVPVHQRICARCRRAFTTTGRNRCCDECRAAWS